MKISVIILTYNRVKDTIELLQCLEDQTFTDFEIIVVDNNSTDDSQIQIQNNFPDVRYFKIYYNSGVPAGRNFGIVNSKGKYLIFIDNDAEVEKDFLEKVYDTFENNADAGILTFKIVNYYTKDIDMTCWVLDRNLIKNNEFRAVNTFVGAGFAIRKKVFDVMDLLWDKLFFMHEEKEFSLRRLKTDYIIYYVPQIIVYHKVSPEKRYEPNERFFFYGIRNEFWVYIRNVPLIKAIPHLAFVAFSAFLYSIRKGFFSYYIKGIFQGVFFSGKAWKRRDPISIDDYKLYESLLNKKKDKILIRLKRFLLNNE